MGTKDFDNYELLKQELIKEHPDLLVVGGKAGPDLLAQEFGLEMDIPTQVFLPDYHLYGRMANYQRNLEMIANSNSIIIFWNERSRSPFNYLSCIKKCKKNSERSSIENKSVPIM